MELEELLFAATIAADHAVDEFWDYLFENIGDDWREIELNPISITIGDKSYVIQLGQMIRIQTV